jgi:hypothetical protein
MEISPAKPETVAFLGEDPVRCETIVDNKCLQKVKNFKYFRCEICCGNEKYVQKKPAQFAQILGIQNNTFIPEIFNNKTT